jgi:hypothetical protein
MLPDAAAYGWAAGIFCTVGYGLYFWRLKTSPHFNPQAKDLLVWALVSRSRDRIQPCKIFQPPIRRRLHPVT